MHVRIPTAVTVAMGKFLNLSCLMSMVPRRKTAGVPREPVMSEAGKTIRLLSLRSACTGPSRGIRQKFSLGYSGFARKEALSGEKLRRPFLSSRGARKFVQYSRSIVKVKRLTHLWGREESNPVSIHSYFRSAPLPTVREISRNSKAVVGRSIDRTRGQPRRARFVNARSPLVSLPVSQINFGGKAEGIRLVPPFCARASVVSKRSVEASGQSAEDVGIDARGSFRNNVSMPATINRDVTDRIPGSGYLATRSRSAMFDELAYPQYAGASVGF